MIRKWKLLSPLLVIVMVFSLVAGAMTVMTTPETAFASPAYGLTVHISAPEADDVLCTCESFNLTFTIENTGEVGEDAYCVKATIDPGAHAQVSGLGEGVPWTTPELVHELAGGATSDPFTYTMHCTSEGSSVITVTPEGWETDDCTTTAITTDLVPGTVTVHQVGAKLEATINTPSTGDSFCVGQAFDVIATVENTGDNTATSVGATIGFAPASATAGTESWTWPTVTDGVIPAGDTATVTWAGCTCDAVGKMTITVTPSGQDSTETYDIPDANITAGTAIVGQLGAILRAEITSPTCGETLCTCEDFTLTFIIFNDGTEAAKDVGAIIDPGSHAEVDAHGEGNTHDTGVLAATLADGANTGPISYDMHCTSAGDTMITVTPYGLETEGETDYPIPDTNLISACCEMHQVELIGVVINSPTAGTVVTVGQTFTLNATVTNYATVDATSVELAYSLTGSATPTTGTTTFALISAGGSGTHAWSLECTGTTDVVITVTATGTFYAGTPDEKTCSDSATVTVGQEALTLIVDIERPETSTVFDVCPTQSFYVNAVITNPYDTTVEDVYADITITPSPGTATIIDGADPQGPVDIPGKTAEDFWWELRCTGAGDVDIRVDARVGAPEADSVGHDEVTIHQGWVLFISIEEPPFTWAEYPYEYTVCPCQTFAVKAYIYNVSKNVTATDIHAGIYIDDTSLADLIAEEPTDTFTWRGGVTYDGEKVLDGDLAPGEYECVVWTLHCKEPGAVTITVDAKADDKAGGALTEDQIVLDGSAYWDTNPTTVTQASKDADVTVSLSAPEKVCIDCWQDFTVTAYISNIGCAAATDVSAELTAIVGADKVAITEGLYVIGTIPGLSSTTHTWAVKCTGEGSVTLQVEVKGTDTGPSGGTFTATDTAAVSQQDFIVEIYNVDARYSLGSYYVSACQNFDVTARLWNCTGDELTNSKATITLPASTELAADSVVTIVCTNPATGESTTTVISPAATTVTIPKICECCYCDVTWTLLCVSSTGGEAPDITVTATTALGVELDHAVLGNLVQESKVHLIAGIDTYSGRLSNGTFNVDPATEFGTCQYFTVVIPVTNIGEATATDVVATINVTGNAEPDGILTYYIGTIYSGESEKAIFELHCTGVGTVTITNPDEPTYAVKIEGNDINTGVAILAANINIPCSITVTQVAAPELEVVIIQPVTCDEFDACQEFCVKALVTNNGATTINSVSATVHLYNYDDGVMTLPCTRAELPTVATHGWNEIAKKTLGNIPAGMTFEVGWVVHCTSQGDVAITVTASSAELAPSVSEAVIVHQVVPAEITVTILSPADGTYIATCQEFAVTAKIYNTFGAATVDNVLASIGVGFVGKILGNGDGSTTVFYLPSPPIAPGCQTIYLDGMATTAYTIDYGTGMITFTTAPASGVAITADYVSTDLSVEGLSVVAPGATQSVGSIPGGTYVIATWTLHCDKAGDKACETALATFVVCASGTDTFGYTVKGVSDPSEVTQYPAAHLVVDITDYPTDDVTVCQDFTITAKVSNTGWCDAWEVSAILSVEPEGSARVAAGDVGYTQYIGTLTGYGQEDVEGLGYKVVSWTLHCKVACESTITVTAEGKDECGCHLQKVDYLYGGWDPAEEEWYWATEWVYELFTNPGAEIPEQFIEPDSITVKQVESPFLAGEIPVIAPEQVYVGSPYQVIAILENSSGTDATGVTATISISGPASTTESLIKDIGTIPAGNETTVSWELSCDGKGGVGITVTVVGTNTNTAVGAATVQQTVDPDTWIVYLAGINASLESIDGNIATLSTDVGEMKVTLEDISATLVSIEDGMATIETAIGTITTSLDSINATLVEIKDGMATIETTIGTITTSLDSINATIVEVKDGIATIHTDLGTIKTTIENISLEVPAEVSVGSWYWLIGPILGGFALLSIVIYVAVRKRPPAPPAPPTPPAGPKA